MTDPYIRQLQEYLYYISLADPDIPRIVPDGIYGPQTEEAVRAFQKQYGIPVTGNADSITWNSIKHIYEMIMEGAAEPQKLCVFPNNGYIVSVGEKSDTVSFIQLILKSLSVEYEYPAVITVTGTFNDRDSRAVKVIQRVHGLEQTGAVDCDTWNSLASDFGLLVTGCEY